MIVIIIVRTIVIVIVMEDGIRVGSSEWDGTSVKYLFPVKAITRGLGTDLRYYEPTANATFGVVWRLEWNGMEYQ